MSRESGRQRRFLGPKAGETSEIITPLLGSAEDVGYIHTTLLINNSTRMQFMLSTKSQSTFFACPEEFLICNNDETSNSVEGTVNSCGLDENLEYRQTFVGASTKGHVLKQAWICLDSWCSP